MEKYEILEHKADLKILVFGRTKEELFLNAAIGMQNALEAKLKKKSAKRKIKAESTDISALLVDFLSEVLYQIQTHKEVYQEVKFKKFTNTEIEAEVSGQKVESFGEDIKAVTHHGLDIRQNQEGGWEAIILFDI